MSGPARLDLRGTVPDAAALAPAVAHVRAGGALAYPTETTYGFGALCTPEGVGAVRRLKPRDAGRPFLALIRDAGDTDGLVWTEAARELASVFWPGALTLVLADPAGIFPDGIRSGTGTVAVRVSPHPLVRALLAAVGGPLSSTSANAPGAPPAQSGDEAFAAVVATGAGGEVMVLDVGRLPASAPSTLVDCTGAVPVVLRQGSVPVNRLRCAIPEIHDA